jgi:hypothetical protein
MRVGGRTRVSDVSEFTVHDKTKDFYLLTSLPSQYGTILFVLFVFLWGGYLSSLRVILKWHFYSVCSVLGYSAFCLPEESFLENQEMKPGERMELLKL